MRLLRPVAVTIVAAILFAFGAVPAFAVILVEIDKSTQRMTVSQDGVQLYHWPVSTGLRAYDTPAGSYTPFRMEKEHYSKEWDDAPMPHSIFFTMKGHAIHGSMHVRRLGTPASHGCIRLPMYIADYFPELVETGQYVYVWDGKKEPEAQSEKDRTPIFNFKNPDSTTTSSTSFLNITTFIFTTR